MSVEAIFVQTPVDHLLKGVPMKRIICALLAGMMFSACDDDGGSDYKNFCENVTCGNLGVCVQGAEGPYCICTSANSIADGNGSCISTNANVCDSLDCSGHGICIEEADNGSAQEDARKPRCYCESGYEPTADKSDCQAVTDKCSTVNCNAHGRCVTAGGAAFCICDEGYAHDTTPGVGDASVISCVEGAQDECSKKECGDHAVCVLDAENQPQCVCLLGYTSTVPGDSEQTVAGDETKFECKRVEASAKCDLPCGDHGTCILDADNNAACVCYNEYYYDAATKKCVPKEVTGCTQDGCGEGGTCVLLANGNASCVCKTGYKPSSDGTECQSEGSGSGCTAESCGLGTCVATADGDSICVCQAGAVLDDAKNMCVLENHPCATGPCNAALDVPGGECIESPVCTTTDQEGTKCSYKEHCICYDGFVANPEHNRCSLLPATALPSYVPANMENRDIHPNLGLPYVKNRFLVYAAANQQASDVLAQILQAIAGSDASVVAYEPNVRRYIVEHRLGCTDADNATTDCDENEKHIELLEKLQGLISTQGGVIAVTEEFIDVPSMGRQPNDDWEGDAWDASSPLKPSGANWYLEALEAPAAWEYARGAHVKVGVIDFGINDHEDLVDNIANKNLLGNSVSSYVRDHGTAVAGLIGAVGDNGIGLTGVLWSPAIYFCQTDGTLSRLGNCLEWLSDNGVHVVNYSANHAWKGGDPNGTWITANGREPWTATPTSNPLANRYIALSHTLHAEEVIA